MLKVTNLSGLGGKIAVPAMASHINVTPGDNASNQSQYTYSGVNIGAVVPRRMVCALIASHYNAGGGRTVTAVTIGGVSATIGKQATAGSGVSQIACIAAAIVPSGTTASIVITYSGTMQGMFLDVLVVKDALSVSPTFTGSDITLTGADLSIASVSAPSNGIVIGVGQSRDAATASWSALTEQTDTTYNSGGKAFTSAWDFGARAASTETLTWSAAPTNAAMVAAAYR